jgi:hypothetical protein
MQKTSQIIRKTDAPIVMRQVARLVVIGTKISYFPNVHKWVELGRSD